MTRSPIAKFLLACALLALGAPLLPAQDKAPPAPKRSASAEKPAPHRFKEGMPVGLYFMTRFWPASGSLEKAVWYFAPDGTVYRNVEHGFSAADLAAHAGRKGTGQIVGKALEVTWTDGKKTKSNLQPSQGGKGFAWDAGIFTAITPFGEAAEVSGVYEGGESLSAGANRAAVSRRLELRRNGTFAWRGVSFLSSTTEASRVSAGSSGAETTGTWRIDSYALILTDSSGVEIRRIAFPYDDEKTPLKPDRMFFGGTLYNKQP